MNGILWATFLLAAASYLVSCGLFVTQARRKTAVWLPPVGPLRLLVLGAVFHLAYLVLYSVVAHLCPVFSIHTALGIVSLVGVVTFAVVGRGRKLEAVGGFVSALAAVFLVATHAIAARPAALNHRWLMALHITANLVGGSILLIAGAASAFYLWSERRLRQRRSLGQGPKLPPLEALDSIVHRLLWIGVPLLTVGIFTGEWATQLADSVSTGSRVRAVFSLGSWLLLLGVLVLRQWRGWRGRRPAYAALLGVLGILLVIVLYVARAVLGANG
jgi:ABC-type uncharacterized transport system permease subunit